MTTKPVIVQHGEGGQAPPSQSQIVIQILVIGLLLVLLINYKGAAGLTKIRQTLTADRRRPKAN